MDPDRALHRVTELAREVLDINTDEVDAGDLVESAWELCENLLALDAWMRNGGCLPAVWKNHGPRRSRGRGEAGQTLETIHASMDGKAWSPDTLETIADILRRAGFTIHEPHERGSSAGEGG